jgi:hypothetical protein
VGRKRKLGKDFITHHRYLRANFRERSQTASPLTKKANILLLNLHNRFFNNIRKAYEILQKPKTRLAC